MAKNVYNKKYALVKMEYPGVVQLIERAVWDREARGFEPHHSDQRRNFHHRSVSGFAENCTLVGISSLSAATRFAGLAAERDGGYEVMGRSDLLGDYVMERS